MGYVDETGWHELVQVPSRLKHSTDYDVLLSINGTTATLVVDNDDILSYAYEARVDDDGFAYGLNYGLVGLGGISSVARVDNLVVQKLAPEITFEANETFAAGAPGFTPTVGDWQVTSGTYQGTSVLPDAEAISLFDLDVEPNSYLELEAAVNPDTLGGVVFDYYSDGTYKFAGVLADTDQVVIGHVGKSGNIVPTTRWLTSRSACRATANMSCACRSTAQRRRSRCLAVMGRTKPGTRWSGMSSMP